MNAVMNLRRLLAMSCALLGSMIYADSSVVSRQQADDQDLLAIVLMVKNEEQVVCDTLQPYVDAGIKQILVFDTGSTDFTVKRVQEFYKKNKIEEGVIKQEPFVDFSVSRNRALELAREAFPRTTFFLMPDAEWYIQKTDELIKFCQEHKNAEGDMFGLRLVTPSKAYFIMHRLIRAGSAAHFEYPVHEYTVGSLIKDLPEDICFEFRPTSRGVEKSKARLQRDLELLKKKFAEDPEETRAAFYIAQTYTELDQWDKALEWYQQRASMGGWDEETFVAQYRVGNCYEALGKWDQAINAYHKAYSMRSTRIEPLMRIANYYLRNNELKISYVYAKAACDIELPKEDICFVEKEVYDFVRYNTMSITAWYAGDMQGGLEATQKALIYDPIAPHLHYNLSCYKNALNKVSVKDIEEKAIVIISVGYNNAKYYKGNLDSTMRQNYSNYRLIYIDADSPDGTFDLVKGYVDENAWNDRITLIKNEKRCGSAENIYNAIQMCNPEEIIVMVEADDQLAHANVLKKVNEVYSDPDVWMTYGNYTQIHPTYGHCSHQLPDEVITNNAYRAHPWSTSHLRTYYAWLAQQIKKEDCMCNGEFYPYVSDLVIMFPILEMAGRHSRFIPDILYVWNNDSPLNEGKVNANATDVYADRIRSAPRYAPLTKSLLDK